MQRHVHLPGDAQAESLWTIVPLATPRVWRHCRGCGAERGFASSDRFRVNANQRRLDVWLIYRCTQCETTWNRELFARVTPADIDAPLYQRLLQNDREAAWRYAFDVAGLRADADVAIRVDRRDRPIADPGAPRRIRLQLAYPCQIRLDRVLARELGMSRTRLRQWHSAGRLCVLPDRRKPLRKPARHDQLVVLDTAIFFDPG